MKKTSIVSWIGVAIIAIICLLDWIYTLPLPLVFIGCCIGAVLMIVSMYMERKNKK